MNRDERRWRLVELAAHYGVPIVEDDPYGQLRYEGDHLPPLVQIDAEHHGCNGGTKFRGGVIYLGTMSKVMAPGLRLGWVVAPEEVMEKLVQMKQGMDLHTSTFTQMVAYETARGGFLDRHVKRIRQVYRERRNTMLAALERYAPPGVSWTHPSGGLFLWLTLPEGLSSKKLFPEALKEKVAYVAGHSLGEYSALAAAGTFSISIRPSAPTNNISAWGTCLLISFAIATAGKICPPVPPPLSITLSAFKFFLCFIFCTSAYTKYYTEGYHCEPDGRSAHTQQGQWLPGYRKQVHCHSHVHQSLKHQTERKTDCDQRAKRFIIIT